MGSRSQTEQKTKHHNRYSSRQTTTRTITFKVSLCALGAVAACVVTCYDDSYDATQTILTLWWLAFSIKSYPNHAQMWWCGCVIILWIAQKEVGTPALHTVYPLNNTNGCLPVRGQHHGAALLDDAVDAVPEGPACFGVHPSGGLVLWQGAQPGWG